jgi:hypothetical protein
MSETHSSSSCLLSLPLFPPSVLTRIPCFFSVFFSLLCLSFFFFFFPLSAYQPDLEVWVGHKYDDLAFAKLIEEYKKEYTEKDKEKELKTQLNLNETELNSLALNRSIIESNNNMLLAFAKLIDEMRHENRVNSSTRSSSGSSSASSTLSPSSSSPSSSASSSSNHNNNNTSSSLLTPTVSQRTSFRALSNPSPSNFNATTNNSTNTSTNNSFKPTGNNNDNSSNNVPVIRITPSSSSSSSSH